MQKIYRKYRCKNDKTKKPLSLNCVVCGGKKPRFMKEQEAEGLLTNLGIKAPLNKIPFLNILLKLICISKESNSQKMLLTGNKFMPEMHLRQLGFTYSACEQFTKNKQRTQQSMQTRDTNYIYYNELDKACFQHDMAYGEHNQINS